MDNILGIIMILGGLIVTSSFWGSDKKILLFISSEIFFTGIVIIVFNNFDMIAPTNFHLMSLSAVSGCALMILYFNYFKKYYLLAGSVLLLSISWISEELLPSIYFYLPFDFSGILTKIALIILIIAGSIYLILRNRNYKPEE